MISTNHYDDTVDDIYDDVEMGVNRDDQHEQMTFEDVILSAQRLHERRNISGDYFDVMLPRSIVAVDNVYDDTILNRRAANDDHRRRPFKKTTTNRRNIAIVHPLNVNNVDYEPSTHNAVHDRASTSSTLYHQSVTTPQSTSSYDYPTMLQRQQATVAPIETRLPTKHNKQRRRLCCSCDLIAIQYTRHRRRFIAIIIVVIIIVVIVIVVTVIVTRAISAK